MKFACLILTFLFVTAIPSYSQEERISVKTYHSRVDEDFDVEKLYHKTSGKKISQEEFIEILQQNPNPYFEKEVNEKGVVTRYLYNPDNKSASQKRLDNQPDINSEFPNFNVNTIDGEEIELADLKGKLVILRFELFASTFRFKKHEIDDLDEKINALPNKEEVKAIIIFLRPEEELRDQLSLEDSNFFAVGNGMNFAEKYGIVRFPTTLIIDQEGKLIEINNDSETILIENYFED